MVDAEHGDAYHLLGGLEDAWGTAVVLVTEHKHGVLGELGLPEAHLRVILLEGDQPPSFLLRGIEKRSLVW